MNANNERRAAFAQFLNLTKWQTEDFMDNACNDSCPGYFINAETEMPERCDECARATSFSELIDDDHAIRFVLKDMRNTLKDLEATFRGDSDSAKYVQVVTRAALGMSATGFISHRA